MLGILFRSIVLNVLAALFIFAALLGRLPAGGFWEDLTFHAGIGLAGLMVVVTLNLYYPGRVKLFHALLLIVVWGVSIHGMLLLLPMLLGIPVTLFVVIQMLERRPNWLVILVLLVVAVVAGALLLFTIMRWQMDYTYTELNYHGVSAMGGLLYSLLLHGCIVLIEKAAGGDVLRAQARLIEKERRLIGDA